MDRYESAAPRHSQRRAPLVGIRNRTPKKGGHKGRPHMPAP